MDLLASVPAMGDRRGVARVTAGSSSSYAGWELRECANPACGRKLTHMTGGAFHWNGGKPWSTCRDCIGYRPARMSGADGAG